MKDEKPKPTVQERIAKYLEAVPGAIDGQGGGAQTFKVACTLYNGWGLSEGETLAWLKIYNAKCEPRWSEKELTHKANGAAKAAHEKPRGYLLGTPTEDQRSEPDWALPTKPIASGTVPATLATANFDSHAYVITCVDDSKCLHTREESKFAVANVAKTVFSGMVGPKTGENSEKRETLDPAPASISGLGGGQSTSEPCAGMEPAQLTAAELAEARRIAGELVKLHKAGAIAGADDPEARFYACLLRGFEATFLPK